MGLIASALGQVQTYNPLNKHGRIAMLEPYILAGRVGFDVDPPDEFYGQTVKYRGNRSDRKDGLEALASWVELARGMERLVQEIRRVQSRMVRW